MKVIPEKYHAVRGKVEQQLATIDKCTMTTDMWTSSHQQLSYISLTVHFVDADFKLHSLCLQTLEVPQDHNGESLYCVLSSMFQDWNILDNVFGGTTDN